MIAGSGSSCDPIRTFHGTRYGRSRSGSTTRNRTIEIWAMVTASSAPNA